MYYSDYNRPQEDPELQEFQPLPTPPVPQRKKRVWPKVLALLLCCALVGGAAGVGGALLTRSLTPAPAVQENSVPQKTTTIFAADSGSAQVNFSNLPTGQALTPKEVYAANVNSVVGIVTQMTTNVWGQQVSSAAAGSGFVLTGDGYIVTNCHVVEDADSVTVKFKSGEEYPATVVGTESENDVAVLKIDAAGLIPVRLGSSAELVVGEQVAAIGNPLGEMTFSMTAGIVSALDKPLTMSSGTVINVLQTDAAINSGNSGGPLFNMYGQVVGITNAKYSNNGSTKASIEGICFAIPIDDVKSVLQDLIEHGYVTGKAYAGCTLATVNARAAAQYGRPGGAYVQSVIPGGAADKAGLKKGDIITAVDGEEIAGHADFLTIRNRHRAGDTVTLTVDRDAKTITLSLTYDERKPAGQQPDEDPQETQAPGDYGFNYNFGGYDPFGWFGW